jgi:hypothetical protein
MSLATRPKAAAPSPPPDVPDDSPSEHIYIGSEDLNPDPAVASRTVVEEVRLGNPVHRTRTKLTIYAEGFLKVDQYRGNKRCASFRLDLHYLDPVPNLKGVVAVRSLYTTLGSAAVAGLAATLLRFEVWPLVTLSVLFAAVVATLVALFVSAYRSYERTEFVTLHGRAPVLRLYANFGSIKRFRAAVPKLARAIEEAADQIGEDTSAYLRAEMREHYRLRGDGLLSRAACGECTGRILAQFDVRL